MKKSIENRLYLKKRIFRFQHKKGTSMNEHLNDFNKMIADLKEIDDEDKALLLLNSLLTHMNISSPLYCMVKKRLNSLMCQMLW